MPIIYRLSPLPQVESEDDHGNDAPSATPFSPPTQFGETIAGTIEIPGDVDWFSFEIFRTLLIRMETALITTEIDTFLTLVASDGITVLAENDDNVGLESRIDANLGPGTYYVIVRHFDPTSSGESYTTTISDITP